MDDLEIEIIEDAELPQRPPPLERGRFQQWGRPESGAVSVLIHQQVLRETQEHARSTPEVEIGGVLVGEVYQHEDHTYTEVRHYVFIPSAVGLRSSNVHFNFSGDVWTALNQLCDIQYPDLTIVGWFHSHPNHGIFLSSMDLDVQRKAAYRPWQIAMVYDPQRHEGGIFSWRGTEMAKAPGFYELFALEQTGTILNWRNVGVPAGAQPPPAPVLAAPAAPPATGAPARPTGQPVRTAPLVVQPAHIPGQISRRPPRPRRGFGRVFFGLSMVLLAAALITGGAYAVRAIMDYNLSAQQSAFEATRSSDEAQFQTKVAGGDASATAAVATVQGELMLMRQTQTAEAALYAAAAEANAATQTRAAATQTHMAQQIATAEALLTAPPPTPTLAATPTPTNTATPETPPTTEVPPTVLITPAPPGGQP